MVWIEVADVLLEIAEPLWHLVCGKSEPGEAPPPSHRPESDPLEPHAVSRLKDRP